MRRRLTALGALALLALPALAMACPSCENALASDPGAHAFAQGVFWSILFMLGMLFSLIGVIIWKFVQLAKADPGGGTAPGH